MGISATKSDIDIKFLSSRLNSLKENVDYLINRKAEVDMKLDNFQKAMAQFILKTEQMIATRPEPEVAPLVSRRLDALEERIEKLPGEIIEDFVKAMAKATSKQEQTFPSEARGVKMVDVERGRSPTDFGLQVNDLLEKINSLENKLRIMERQRKLCERGASSS